MKVPFSETVGSAELRRIKSKKWYRHGIYREDSVLALVCQIYIGKEWFAKEGMPKGIDNLARTGDPVYLDGQEAAELVALYAQRLKRDGIRYLQTYIKGHRSANEEIVRVAKELSMSDPSAMDNAALKDAFERYFATLHEASHWLWSLEFLNPAFDKYLDKKTREAHPEFSDDDCAAILSVAVVPSKKLPFQLEKEEILASSLDESALRELHEKYSWLSINVMNGRPFTFEEYEKRARGMKADAKLEVQVADLDAAMAKAAQVVADEQSQNFAQLLEVTRELIYLKTWRIDSYSRSWALMLPLVSEITKRLALSGRHIMLLTEWEVADALDGAAVPDDFGKREQTAAIVLDGRPHLYYGDAYRQVMDILNRDDFSHVKELRGAVGYRGIVRGPAKVLMTDRDLSKLEKGDILVANLTNPNYDPAFGIVAGVVTDEGGVLCHSAIMAREFKIPCVIGTKIATLSLKDGDMIEVDADNGIVRRI